MNRYHEYHQDPDVRQKFREWQEARSAHRAKSAGFNTQSEHEVAMAKDKEARKSVEKMLASVGGQKVKGSKFATKASGKQAHKRMRTMQRTGGQRGS